MRVFWLIESLRKRDAVKYNLVELCFPARKFFCCKRVFTVPTQRWSHSWRCPSHDPDPIAIVLCSPPHGHSLVSRILWLYILWRRVNDPTAETSEGSPLVWPHLGTHVLTLHAFRQRPLQKSNSCHCPNNTCNITKWLRRVCHGRGFLRLGPANPTSCHLTERTVPSFPPNIHFQTCVALLFLSKALNPTRYVPSVLIE